MMPPSTVETLTVELRALERLMAEQDRRYAERDQRYQERHEADQEALRTALTAAERAVGAAMASAEKAVSAALAAVEKASTETKENLREYKAGANEWKSTVLGMSDRMPTRLEVDRIREELGKLEMSMQRGAGKDEAQRGAAATTKWVIGLVVIVVLSIMAQAASLLANLLRGP